MFPPLLFIVICNNLCELRFGRSLLHRRDVSDFRRILPKSAAGTPNYGRVSDPLSGGKFW